MRWGAGVGAVRGGREEEGEGEGEEDMARNRNGRKGWRQEWRWGEKES